MYLGFHSQNSSKVPKMQPKTEHLQRQEKHETSVSANKTLFCKANDFCGSFGQHTNVKWKNQSSSGTALIGAAEAAAYQMEEKGRHRNCTQLSLMLIQKLETRMTLRFMMIMRAETIYMPRLQSKMDLLVPFTRATLS